MPDAIRSLKSEKISDLDYFEYGNGLLLFRSRSRNNLFHSVIESALYLVGLIAFNAITVCHMFILAYKLAIRQMLVIDTLEPLLEPLTVLQVAGIIPKRKLVTIFA